MLNYFFAQIRKFFETKPTRNNSQGVKDEFITPDLQDMILQRVPAEQLKETARVRKNWRSYIKENSEKMRMYEVNGIEIYSPSQAKIFYYYHKERYEKEVTIPSLMIYSTRELCFATMSKKMVTKLSSQLEGFPDWWINGIKEISFDVTCLYALSTFIQRFSYLDQLNLHEHRTNILERTTPKEEIPDLLKAFIENAPMTKQFQIQDLSVNDSFLELIIEKSRRYPTEFPITYTVVKFTVAQVIRFLELNKFPRASSHKIELHTVIGEKGEMQNWIKTNTKRIPKKRRKPVKTLPTVRRAKKPEISCKFRYRSMLFDFQCGRFETNV